MGDLGILRSQRIAEDDQVATSGNYFIAATPNATAHVKGSYVTIAASTPFAVAGMIVTYSCSTSVNYLADIAIGSAGNEIVVFPNLHLGAFSNVSPGIRWFFLPLSVPAHVRLAIRCQAGGASATALNFKASFIPVSSVQIPTPQRWEAWGIVTGTTILTAMTTGSANVKGTAVQLIASSGFKTTWVGVATRFGTGATSNAIDLMIGSQVIVGDLYNQDTDNAMGPIFFPLVIPSGSQIQGRAASNPGSRTQYLGAWGGA